MLIDYTIPSDNRELQLPNSSTLKISNYTIPSDNRELQQATNCCQSEWDYTIPSDNRELQLLIPVFSASSYYTIPSDNRELQREERDIYVKGIIPYQVITGNYNKPPGGIIGRGLYHTK